eukprot:XP_001693778.1 predicted protein [Chlamydomonas reinhardtii]
MPLDIQPAAYQIGCRIRGRAGGKQGGAACFERGKGIFDPANAEAVAAGRKQTVIACNKAQGKVHGKPLGSCAACEVEQEETPAVKRWGANGVPLCARHYSRWNNWKRLSKHAKLADALRKAEAMDLASDSDSDVEIVGG